MVRATRLADPDLEWSPLRTWIVIGVSASLVLFLFVGAAIYECLIKSNSYACVDGECVAVRGGPYETKEICLLLGCGVVRDIVR